MLPAHDQASYKLWQNRDRCVLHSVGGGCVHGVRGATAALGGAGRTGRADGGRLAGQHVPPGGDGELLPRRAPALPHAAPRLSLARHRPHPRQALRQRQRVSAAVSSMKVVRVCLRPNFLWVLHVSCQINERRSWNFSHLLPLDQLKVYNPHSQCTASCGEDCSMPLHVCDFKLLKLISSWIVYKHRCVTWSFCCSFPLYSKGKERFQFSYGVYLLNKNIAQVRLHATFPFMCTLKSDGSSFVLMVPFLYQHRTVLLDSSLFQMRYYCGLGTTDLRMTLPNLKTLLELRLGVKL